MRRAHSEGRLFEALTEWLPSYRGLRTGSGGDAYANRMRDIVGHGCPLWESVVAEVGRPWSDYIPPEQLSAAGRVARLAQVKRHSVRSSGARSPCRKRIAQQILSPESGGEIRHSHLRVVGR
jgi:hypothetical protein